MSIKHVLFVFLLLPGLVFAEPLTLPLEARPEWLSREGIVMAGSWEPLPFRVRRDGAPGYTPTPEQLAAYRREHSPEMVARLKDLGVNFVMMHCYKGGGMEAERQSMADAVSFAKLCHDAGMRVGVYNYSGALIWELFFKEVPQAKDWILLDEQGRPKTYGGATYRYYWNRNHPRAVEFYKGIVQFAVNDIKADLIHFDNYGHGPAYDANSIERFRRYLRATFTPGQLNKMGAGDLDAVKPPSGAADNLLRRAWLEFSCKSLADSYCRMCRYARSLRKDILVECNPHGPGGWIRPPVDHGRLLQGGEAFWDEGQSSSFHKGRLHTKIRTYKVARCMNNIAFTYTRTALEMAESMAFNLDFLGCVCWFEYGRISNFPGRRDPVAAETAPFIRFFHRRRDLLREANVVADVAVLRSFPSQVFAPRKHAQLTYEVERRLIERRACFQIIYDHQLEDLSRYRALVLAGCVGLSDEQVEQIKQYVRAGGGLCVVGPAAQHNEWMIARDKPALDDLPTARTVRIAEDADVLEAVRRACGGELSLSIEPNGPRGEQKGERDTLLGLCAELTEQPHRRLVHLVNYRDDGPVENIAIRLHLPEGRRVEGVTLASPRRKEDLKIPFSNQTGVVTFTVPAVRVYEIAVVALN